MDNHIRILAILHIVYGALKVLGAFIVLLLSRLANVAIERMQYRGELGELSRVDLYSLVHLIALLIFWGLLILGLGSIISGWGLLARQGWARVLVLVFGVIALVNIPFGTALGIYTLWVIFKSDQIKGAAVSA